MRPKQIMSFTVQITSSKVQTALFCGLLGPVLLFCRFATCDPYSKLPLQAIANKFGVQMLSIGYERTCFESISEKFQKHRSEVRQIDATKMMEEMRTNLINMLNWKKEAVERIANQSEKLSEEHIYENEIDYVGYYNMKSLYDDRYSKPEIEDTFNSKALPLSPHPNFENSLVNLYNSAVHVPINVYDKATDILNDIKWSEKLTETFRNNLANDPSLSWQFFGSSKGFIRIYPATKWKVPHDAYGQSKTPMPDMYDCRVRQWYIQSAASPKDMVILMDVSGSMTGQRRTIAINVVMNILDTLNENDFVMVYNFTSDVKTVNPCFKHMVQATPRNINEIKLSLENPKTADIANFTAAFIEAFDILKKVFKEKEGAQCNQAIMLITDGSPETYEPLFQQYNADKSIRIFTYVIGRDVTQINEVNWMACNNRGFYAQVANLAEVREQVQQYIPVMSRPLVLSGTRIFTWTPVYTAYSEIQLTDWIWDERVKALKTKILQQTNRDDPIEENIEFENIDQEKKNNNENDESNNYEETPAEDLYYVRKKLFDWEQEMAKRLERKKIQLMTTISTPVFDMRKYINVTRKILLKNVYKDSEPELIRIANLLGVAGIDVLIKEIEKMAPQFKLGVNGYSFMLTNNGKVLFHPDFRPIYQDMLKPFYSSVDLTEVEMGNNTQEARVFDSNIEQIRSEMISGLRGSKKFASRTFIDSMKRPTTRLQHYLYDKVDNTPFSFAISLPEPYGSFRFMAQVDLMSKYKTENFTRYFSGTRWRIHPEWVYCENPHKLSLGLVSSSPEEALLQFLSNELPENNYRWRSSGGTPPRYDNFTCDKDLLQSLIFDAMNTHIFDQCSDFSSKFIHRRDAKSSIDIVNAFVSTRSGLTRFTNSYFSYDNKNRSEHEYNSLARSIEEIYYRRAVDFYYIDNKAFVYSIPFDASHKDNEFTVTSSHAIFVGNGKMTAPVAVIGVQYNYTQFRNAFFKTADMYKLNCQSDDNLDCFVLDNNGFIIISEDNRQAGLFFGEVNDDLLQDMVRNGIYRKLRFYDYQAICIDITPASSSSMSFLSPLQYIRQIAVWFASKLATFYLNLAYDSAWFALSDDSEDVEYESESTPSMQYNKSRPKPCDKETDLYDLTSFPNQTLHLVYQCKADAQCRRGYNVQHIPHSNLIIVSLYKNCSCLSSPSKLETRMVYMDTRDVEKKCQFFNTVFQTEQVRKRPEACFNFHKTESEIKYCGGCASLKTALAAYLLCLLVAILARQHLAIF